MNIIVSYFYLFNYLQMEKLLNLLNEYSVKEKFGIIWKIGDDPTGIYGYVNDMYGLGWASDLVICSARYGFIKWLVENNKIDILQLDNRIALSEFNKVERVLMALSISDTPIDDLILYLK